MFASVVAAIALAVSGLPQSTQTPGETATYAAEYRDLAAAYAAAPRPVIVSVDIDRGRNVVRITGTAPAIWFTENQFPIALEDDKGDGIGDFLAHAPHTFGDEENESWAFAANVHIRPGTTPATVIVSADLAGEWGDAGPPPTPTVRFAIPAEPR